MSFVTPEILSKLGALTSAAADRASFGVFQLDEKGRVLMCNRAGCELVGVDRIDAPGKSFFEDLAPSAEHPLFQGRFVEGIRRGELNQAFEYSLRTGSAWVEVEVQLLRHPFSRTHWIFIRKCPEASDSPQAALARLRDQLTALHQERASRAQPTPGERLPQGSDLFQREIARLTQEKQALESELQTLKRRARDIGAAIFEAALLGKKISMP